MLKKYFEHFIKSELREGEEMLLQSASYNYDNFNIKLNENFVEQILNEGIDIQASVERIKHKLFGQKKRIQDAGYDAEELEKKIKMKASTVAGGVRGSKNPEAASKSITRTLVEIFKEIDVKHIPKSLLLLVLIFIINSFAAAILTVMFGPIGGMVLTSVVVAPMTEEYAKNLSIKEGHSGTFFVVFNTAEVALYLGKGASLAVRMLPLMMHLTTTVVQRRIMKDPNGPDDKDKKAFATGVLIHGIYNFLAVAGSI
jgi:hypothetical protein